MFHSINFVKTGVCKHLQRPHGFIAGIIGLVLCFSGMQWFLLLTLWGISIYLLSSDQDFMLQYTVFVCCMYISSRFDFLLLTDLFWMSVTSSSQNNLFKNEQVLFLQERQLLFLLHSKFFKESLFTLQLLCLIFSLRLYLISII